MNAVIYFAHASIYCPHQFKSSRLAAIIFNHLPQSPWNPCYFELQVHDGELQLSCTLVFQIPRLAGYSCIIEYLGRRVWIVPEPQRPARFSRQHCPAQQPLLPSKTLGFFHQKNKAHKAQFENDTLATDKAAFAFINIKTVQWDVNYWFPLLSWSLKFSKDVTVNFYTQFESICRIGLGIRYIFLFHSRYGSINMFLDPMTSISTWMDAQINHRHMDERLTNG